MSDLVVVVVALAAALGALVPVSLPWWCGAGVLGAALLGRSAWLVVAGTVLLTSSASARAWSGLAIDDGARVDGLVTLVEDPRPFGEAVRAVVATPARRLEVWAHGAPASELRRHEVGDRVAVRGRVTAGQPHDRFRRAPRHVAGRLVLDELGDWAPGPPWTRAAGRVRSLLVRGATSLPQRSQLLFRGFVLGDDRDHPPEMVETFRGAGLTHLLAVSGQNVGFVLALAAPLLQRGRIGVRWAGSLTLIVFFAVVTRLEPSVLRAGAMAAIAATATALGRPASGVRVLALAVSALLVVDPLLVHAVGFQLSVGASFGILVVAPRLAPIVPLPAPVATAVATALAAQLGVAPIAAAHFGGVPVVSLPANLLAVPVAGPLMMWGMAAGLVAGIVQGPIAAWLHVPTRLGIAWVDGVARRAATLPLGTAGPVVLALVALAVLVAVALDRTGRRRAARGCGLLAVAASLAPAVAQLVS